METLKNAASFTVELVIEFLPMIPILAGIIGFVVVFGGFFEIVGKAAGL